MAKAKTTTDVPALQRFQVSLPFQPSLTVEATDAADAIAKYNAANGIIQTDHQHQVVPVAEQAKDAAEASTAKEKISGGESPPIIED